MDNEKKKFEPSETKPVHPKVVREGRSARSEAKIDTEKLKRRDDDCVQEGLDNRTKEAIADMLRKVAEEEGLANAEEKYKAVKIDKPQTLSELSNVELKGLYDINRLLYDEFNNYVAIDHSDMVHKVMMGKTVSLRKKLIGEMWKRIKEYNSEEEDAKEN